MTTQSVLTLDARDRISELTQQALGIIVVLNCIDVNDPPPEMHIKNTAWALEKMLSEIKTLALGES